MSSDSCTEGTFCISVGVIAMGSPKDGETKADTKADTKPPEQEQSESGRSARGQDWIGSLLAMTPSHGSQPQTPLAVAGSAGGAGNFFTEEKEVMSLTVLALGPIPELDVRASVCLCFFVVCAFALRNTDRDGERQQERERRAREVKIDLAQERERERERKRERERDRDRDRYRDRDRDRDRHRER